LTIAGSDSGGGAGIQADLKTFQRLGVFGTSVVTAVTAQNTRGVSAWESVSPKLVSAQIDAVFEDLPPAAMKSGMLGTADVAEAVCRGIEQHRPPFYVLDPVMLASSGDALIDDRARKVLAERLVSLATLVTPNLAEAEELCGMPVRDRAGMEAAGNSLIARGAKAALIKGGHLESEALVDVLVTADGARVFEHRRLAATSTHGTGCTLSAAITAGLALGQSLEAAVGAGIAFVQRAIAQAPGLGRGNGPLGI
jgi:hydroxymethylpyrimidine/phosphomethylpyrimidine kinase